MTKIKITRKYLNKATIGEGVVENKGKVFRFKTLELPDRDNQRRVSCIPERLYFWQKHNSPKFGPCLWLQDVPNRSEILVHPGNFTRDILGCILVGDSHKDIDSDGITDVTNSRKTMKKILEICGEYGTLHLF